ncbi:MAG: preprotein translocase subunit SecA [Candidatus Pacebacteria bacterium]|jgi:preprotein translocase subunit SecA|nr:preprotein translocase subunit SecA [Candidatus Paceibacterota bacterium]MDD5555486.1 preprotein translocase subunit SecA [Candidatus Paceibacterota bacterium]
MSIFGRFFGDANEKFVKSLSPIVEKINSLEEETSKLSFEELKLKTSELKERLKTGETLDDILPFAFALVREAAKRNLNQKHFDCQLVGGIVLHQGKIAEMKTGEGKTLTATLPMYLNALEGRGCHLVTVNDYLSRRDAVWMGQIYYALGLSVSCLNHEQSFVYDPDYKKEAESKDKIRDELGGFRVVEDFLRPCSRKEAYEADITYGTNNEFGFDYLRDNTVYSSSQAVQREYNFVIVDEVDSILIDEARTPLIISAPDTESSKWYSEFARIIPRLDKETDFEVDEKMKAVTLTEQGIDKIEKILNAGNIYNERGIKYLHHLEQALKAEILFKLDKDYVVRNAEVVIVDAFTGRLMPGRRWSGGLHQAIEAKEGVKIQPESITMASITFQNYFRMYKKLAGMTGTAETSAEEFDKVYKLDVAIIPTNKPMVRKDLPDRIFKTEEAKFRAVAEEVKKRHEAGQPVLIGTTSISKNEYLGAILSREGIPHQILNAKNHEKEGEIIAQAGAVGAVTVATNMAGRGVDISLGGNPFTEDSRKKVVESGGLFVIGTERHEARRIDNQLRGRTGRQGDPGMTQFFVSLEDDVIRIFGGDKIKGLMERFNLPDDTPIENSFISKSIEAAQTKIEGANFDARKYVLEYDDVLNKHRGVIYKRRKEILSKGEKKELKEEILSLFEKEGFSKEDYEKKEKELGEENMREVEKLASLRALDVLWVEHLENMESLRESVRLRAYGQKDPLIEYKNEGRKMFNDLLANYDKIVVNSILKASVNTEPEQEKREIIQEKKGIGRNDPCPCGSGKKYKKCCGKQ